MLTSEPDEAEIFDDMNKRVGITPFDIRSLSLKTNNIIISKDGYESKKVTIARKNRNGLIFIDAMLLCIPCPFDLKNGTISQVQKFDGTLRLRKKLLEHERSISIAIGQPSIEMTDSESFGTVRGYKKTIGDRDFSKIVGSVGETDQVIIASLANTYIEAKRISVFNSNNKTNNAKLIMTPVIKKLDVNILGKSIFDYHGSTSVDCLWNFYKSSNPEKIVASLNVKTSILHTKGNKTSIIDELMAENVKDLLENDTLYNFLVNTEQKYFEESKGSVFTINTPANQNYKNNKEVLKGAVASVVTIEQYDGFGSGVLISNDGYIITNYHVVNQEKNVVVRLSSDVKLNAVVVKTNKDYDLALLKVEAFDLKSLLFGNSETVEIGDDVWAIGTPIATDLGQTITKGIVSGFRKINDLNFIQTDVSINSGNSGGPLINDKGEIIGIITLKISGKGIEGLGFCIPSNYVIEFLNLKFK